jgi:hypothetical protein
MDEDHLMTAVRYVCLRRIEKSRFLTVRDVTVGALLHVERRAGA